MKAILTALIASTAITQATDENENYLNFIIQIQNNPTQTTHKLDDVTPTGNATALRGIDTSSTFQLWTIHRETGQEYLLDEKIVSSYHPTAEIEITTGDPYKPIPRTRVDQAFGVSYTVNGLLPDTAETPDAAKSVVLRHSLTPYGDAAGAPNNNTSADNSIVLPDSEISTNGTTKETRVTSLQAADLTTASGEETFTIFARPDFGVEESSMLANATVQVWPIAQGDISGFVPGQAYSRLPDLKIDLEDLYPSSTTYVRAYLGSPTETPENPILINTSYVIIDDVKTVNRDFILTDLDKLLTESGTYTLELLHLTPFGVDLLHQTDGLVKKNSIKVVGTLGGSE